MSTVRIVHVSDLHLPLAEPVAWNELMSKRLLGLANLKLVRGKHMAQDDCLELLRSAAAEPADAVVVSGDLSNLALDSELSRAATLLRDAGFEPGKTMVLPGNHDRYVPSAEHSRLFERYLEAYLPEGFALRGQYPLVRRVGPVLLLGLDTAVARGPIRSSGRVCPEQLARLEAYLDAPEHNGLWPVVALHHPPLPVSGSALRQYSRGLVGFGKLLRLLEPRGATLIHGHLHLQERRTLGALEVVGVPSCSKESGQLSDAMGYHIYTFGEQGLLGVEAVRFLAGQRMRHALQARIIG